MARVLTIASDSLYTVMDLLNESLSDTMESLDRQVAQLEDTASEMAERRENAVKLYKELKDQLMRVNDLPEEVMSMMVRLEGELS